MWNLIAAVSWPTGVIGRAGRLPWRIPLELALFRQLTWGGILVMGRKTYESLGRAELPGRTIWALSKQSGLLSSSPRVRVFGDWEALLEALARQTSPVFFAGGALLFEKALNLPQLERLYISWVMASVQGDTYFPRLSGAWQPVRWEVFAVGPGVPIPFIFTTYERSTGESLPHKQQQPLP